MKKLYLLLFSLTLVFIISAKAEAVKYTFVYDGVDWGTVEITAKDADTLKLRYDNTTPSSKFSEATGFGFTFTPPDLEPSVSNPLDDDFTDDRDDLVWKKLENLDPIPNPTNDPTLSKNDFFFGVTEGNANNINPPGILPGEHDVFFLDFRA